MRQPSAPAFDHLVRQLYRGTEREAAVAAMRIGRLGGQRSFQTLSIAARAEREATRIAAAMGLSRCDTPAAVGVLLELTRHRRRRVRFVAADSLARFGPRDAAIPSAAIRPLTKMARSGNAGERAAGAVNLGRFSDDRAVQVLTELARGSEPVQATMAIPALGTNQTPSVMKSLLALIDHRDASIRAKAARVLTEHHGGDVSRALAGVLSHGDPKVRYEAAW
jgi:HEAT repeat protein